MGLVAALVGDGVWDALSWLGLGAPVAAIVWCLARRTPDDASAAGREQA